ncbi:MAG: hypothetical protein D6814_03975 [Calditrichaeota bacterium]|nr:MAG: hypothetical protein D6814_03975 [Calditrichota bacterium]
MQKTLILFALTAVFFAYLPGNLAAQKLHVDVDQTLVQIATVKDPRLVRYFADDFMIPDKKIAWMVIYDLGGDGFGDGDIARTYPGGKFYLITPTEKSQRLMNTWSFGGNVKFTAHADDSPELFENAPDSVRAQGGIFAALLRGMRRNYKGKPIKIHLEQSGEVTSIEMWGYNPDLMHYTPPPVNRVPREVPVMKLIYLEKTIVDSVETGAK